MHHFEGRGVDRVAAEIPQEVRMLLQHVEHKLKDIIDQKVTRIAS
jgi:hypothetical protein